MRIKKYILGMAFIMTAFTMSACGNSKHAVEATTEENLDYLVGAEQMVATSGYQIEECVKLPEDALEHDYKINDIPVMPSLEDYINLTYLGEAIYTPSGHKKIKKGDYVNLTYQATLDGEDVLFLCGTSEEYRIGRYDFPVPEIESKLIGEKIGKDITIPVTMAEDFDARNSVNVPEKLSGKEIIFHITVNSIDICNPVTCDTLTDAYIAEKFGKSHGVQTVQQFMNMMQIEYDNSKSSYDKESKRTLVLDYLKKNSEISVPDDMVFSKVDQMVKYLVNQAENCDMTVEEYLAQFDEMPETEQEFRKIYTQAFFTAAQEELLTEALILKSGYRVDGNKIDHFIKDEIKQNKFRTKKEAEEYYGSKEAIALEIAKDEIFNYVISKKTASAPKGE